MKRHALCNKFLSIFILSVFILTSLISHPYASSYQLPIPGTRIIPSQSYTPALLKGLIVHPDQPLNFDFILDSGDQENQVLDFKSESENMIKYFLAAMTIPENDLWVNLSPYEKHRMIPEALGMTVLGRDMLMQDYVLKQLSASLVYPESDLGKEFWGRVFEKAQEKYGTTNIPVDTFSKVWIVPDKAVVYQKDNTVYIVESRLKVLLEEDYLSTEMAERSSVYPDTSTLLDSRDLQDEIMKDIIIPEIEREVNEGQHFTKLRQIYNSLIIATWYKQNIKKSLMSQIYVDQKKTPGIESGDSEVNEEVYDRYVQAFKLGVFDYIREDLDPISKAIIPRKYFSGGEFLGNIPLTIVDAVASSTVLPSGRHHKVVVKVNPRKGFEGRMIGRWFFRETDWDEKRNRLIIFDAVRIPNKDTSLGVNGVEEEFLPKGIYAKGREIVLDVYPDLTTFRSNEYLSQRIEMLKKQLGMEQEVRVFKRDASAIWHRNYGVATKGIFFLREDLLNESNNDQLKEALDFGKSQLEADANYYDTRRNQFKGNLTGLLKKLARKDKKDRLAIVRDGEMTLRLSEPTDSFEDSYQASRDFIARSSEITEDMLQGNSGDDVSRNFIGPDGQLLSKEQLIQNQARGIAEVVFPKDDNPVLNNMNIFLDKLERRFGNKLWIVDRSSLHLKLQSLNREWSDSAQTHTRDVLFHSGRETVNLQDRSLQDLMDKGRSIHSQSFRVQVKGINGSPAEGIFFGIKPFTLPEDKDDPITERRSEWGLPQDPSPRIQAAYIAKPLSTKEWSELQEMMKNSPIFGDVSVDTSHIVAYDDPSLNSGYRILEEIPFNKAIDGESLSQSLQISRLINEMNDNGYSPRLHGEVPLYRTFKEDIKRAEDLQTYLLDKTILTDPEDIIVLLSVKLKDLKGGDLTDDEKKFLQAYDIIFEKQLPDEQINVAVFSGGSGSKLMTQGFLDTQRVDLNFIINAYDDGKSTGDIRRRFNMLGPSDIVKNIMGLLGNTQPKLLKFLDYRFSSSDSKENIIKEMEYVIKGEDRGALNQEIKSLNEDHQTIVRNYLEIFYNLLFDNNSQLSVNVNNLDLRDYGIRNILFVAAYALALESEGAEGNVYQVAIKRLMTDFNVPGEIHLNSNDNLWLIGVTEDGSLLNSEAEIVDNHLEQNITEVFLVERLLNKEEIQFYEGLYDLESKLEYLRKSHSRNPDLHPETTQAIREADINVLAPTTLHSSLAPTFITKGVREVLEESEALKILVANLTRERGRKTVGENIQEIHWFMNFANFHDRENPDYRPPEITRGRLKMDYIIVNTHGHTTGGVHLANRFAVDTHKIAQQGVELIFIDVDPDHTGKHQPDVIAHAVSALHALEGIGLRFHQGRLTVKSPEQTLEAKKKQLRQLIANPMMFEMNRLHIQNLVLDILEIDSMEEYKPKRKIQPVILAAGGAARMRNRVVQILFSISKTIFRTGPIAQFTKDTFYGTNGLPKALHLVEGEANLSHLLKVLNPIFDSKPILAVNKWDAPQFRNWFKAHENEDVSADMVTIDEGGGTANALARLKEKLKDSELDDVFLLWGDSSNIEPKTIQLTMAVHEALDDTIMTIPTAWEEDPYTTLVRDNNGRVSNIAFKSDAPKGQKVKYGEHDGSVFLFKYREILPFLDTLIAQSTLDDEEDLFQDVNFLNIIPLLTNSGYEVSGLATMDPREAAGYNTVKEAEQMAEKKKNLREVRTFARQDIADELNTPVSDEDVDAQLLMDRKFFNSNSKRYKRYLEGEYNALVIDLDDTITLKGQVLDEALENVIKLLNAGIPVGVISGRKNESLRKMFLSRVEEHPRLDGISLKNLYIYPENGAFSYRADLGPQRAFYNRPLDKMLIQATSFFLREYILYYNDNFHSTDHKMQIFPENVEQQDTYFLTIKNLLKILGYPLKVTKSSSKEISGSLLISRDDVDKGVALRHFRKQIKIDVDKIVKIGNMGAKDQSDYDFLVGAAAFSLDSFDIRSKFQVALTAILPEEGRNARGFLHLMKNLNFKKASSAVMSEVGGLDFNNIGIETIGDIDGFEFLNIPDLENLSPNEIKGFEPDILNVVPIPNILPILGISSLDGIDLQETQLSLK